MKGLLGPREAPSRPGWEGSFLSLQVRTGRKRRRPRGPVRSPLLEVQEDLGQRAAARHHGHVDGPQEAVMHLDQVLGRKATACEQARRAGLGVQRLCSGSLGAAAGGTSTCGPGAGCAAPGAIHCEALQPATAVPACPDTAANPRQALEPDPSQHARDPPAG